MLQNDSWRAAIKHSHVIRQAYMVDAVSEHSKASVRIRIQDEHANINIKSVTIGVYRHEYQYAVPLHEANEMIDHLCHQLVIEKQRHIVEHDGHNWEIDEFSGVNAGLLIAEIELGTVDEAFSKPAWLGQEVSDDPRYYNTSLATNPYCNWKQDCT